LRRMGASNKKQIDAQLTDQLPDNLEDEDPAELD
jgi:hypothetical protein